MIYRWVRSIAGAIRLGRSINPINIEKLSFNHGILVSTIKVINHSEKVHCNDSEKTLSIIGFKLQMRIN